jgi:putative flippase GtrA
MKIKELIQKYEDVIPYLFFGVCTTVVNVVVYWICAHLLAFNTMISTVIAWILAVLFAYVTNRKWVFKSTAYLKSEIAKEIVSFFSCRLATGIVDWLCMYIFVELLNFNDVFIKVVANILVIILNYVASKLIIFKKG